MEIDKIKDDSKIDREKNINRSGPRQIGTDGHIPDPPTFWLPTTFKLCPIISSDFVEQDKFNRKISIKNIIF
jgi:hypothetical protein